ncbi:MAG TPA: hypothetical protein VLS49_13580 [Usitatibacter sp.]|nr:hypothetical protein [Usitatibacter sp.]
MKNGTRIAAANAIMALGVLPMLAWFAMLVRSVFRLREGRFDLSDLMFVGVLGMGAYLFTLVVAGAAAIWATGLVSGASDRARRLARFLVSFTAAVLLVPWGGVIALVLSRFFD